VPRVLGDAIVVISPDTRYFRTQADAQIRKALAGINPNVRLGMDTKSALTAVAGFKARVQALSDTLTKMRMDIKDDKGAEAKIAARQAQVLALAKSMQTMTMAADTKKLDAQILGKLADIRKLEAQMSGLKMDADSTRLTLKIVKLEAEAARLGKQLEDMDVDADVSVVEAKFNAVHAELALLKRDASKLDLVMSNVAALRVIGVTRAELTTLQEQARDLQLGANIDPVKLLQSDAALLAMEDTVSRLVPAAQKGDVALGVLGKAITGNGTGWGFLTRDIALFGGVFNRVLPVILSSIKVWHVLGDAIIEIGAVWIPATLAVGAFAFAASDAAVAVQRRMQAMHTELDATGRAIPGLTSGMEALHKAVQPQVYQLFGDAIKIMTNRSGEFATIAKSTGTVIDQLAARLTYAITSGNGFSQFTHQAVTDVAKLGDSIGNVFGIFGNFFKVIPGFAAGLLTIGDDFTKVLEAASAAAEPVLRWVLLLHGYILYSGLAVTATLAFIGGVANLAKQFITFGAGAVLAGVGAIKSFVSIIKTGVLFVYDFITAVAALIAEEGILVATQELLAAVNPFVWVGAAVVALGALVFWMASSKDAAQQFNAAVQQTIQNAQLSNVISTIQQEQAATAARLAGATRQVNAALKEQGPAIQGVAGHFEQNYSPALDRATQLQGHYQQGLTQLQQQQLLVTGRVAALSKEFGGNAQALGILNAAGITTAQITDKNNEHWAQALIQIRSTSAAYKVMGTQAGTLGNDLDILGRSATDQYQAIQKLNQAWSAFISDVTSTQGTFDTVAQGYSTLADHSGKLTLSLGKLKASYADAASGLTANAALASATASVATAQNSLNKLQAAGTGTALQLTAAHARLTAAQDRLSAAQLNLANAQNQGKSAIDALTPAGIALNQAFGDQIGNLDKMFASWRTAGLAGNLFSEGVKSGIAPLLQYAAGSQEATAQLVALAEEAGYQGPISFSALVKWLGSTHGATQRLKDITNQATIQEALLTGAMQSQADFITTQLSRDLTQAVLAYNGVATAVTAYGTAVAHSGKDSTDAKTKLTAAVDAIVKSELSLGDNATQMAAVVAKTFGISMPQAIALVNTSMGNLADKTLPGARNQFRTFAEVGLQYTQDKADALWSALSAKLGPYMDNSLAKSVLGSKQKFEEWAGAGGTSGLGLTRKQADALYLELQTLQGFIDKMHGKTVGVNFVGTGSGNIAFKESIPGVTVGPSSQGLLGFHAAGGFISGGRPFKDSVLAMLMPGEVVVPTDMVSAGAVDHLRGSLPGFADGGVAGGVTSKWSGVTGPSGVVSDAGSNFMAKAEANFGKAVEAAFASAVIKKFNADMNALAGSGNAIVSYAESFLGKIPYVFGGNSLVSGIDCCIIGSMHVQTIRGPVEIRDLNPGDEVYTWNDGKLSVNRVTYLSEPRYQQTYRLRTLHREITASGNHPFLTLRKAGRCAPPEPRYSVRSPQAYAERVPGAQVPEKPVRTRARRRDYQQVDTGQIRDLYLSGTPVREIAETLGISVYKTGAALDETGTPRRRRVNADAAEIRDLYLSGASLSEIAGMLGVSIGTVVTRLDETGTPRRLRGSGSGKPPHTTRNDYALSWVNLEDLQRGDIIVTLKRLPDDAPVPDDPYLSDERFLWLLGLAFGDGTLTASRPNRVTLCVFGELQAEVQGRLEEFCGKRGSPTTTNGLRLHSEILASGLRRYGMDARSTERQLPRELWTLPHSHIQAFLDGYTAADGHRVKRAGDPALSYKAANRPLIEDVRNLHMALGHNVTRVRELKRTRPIVIRGKAVRNARSLWTFEAYETGAKTERAGAGLLARLGIAELFPADSNFAPQKVTSIEALGEDDTYDITVEGTHNFVAEGLVVHNSGFTQAIYGKFGINAPRTSEAQFAWVTPSAAVPGSLAFYVSAAGGPPPGHVAIVANAGHVISQGGGMGPTMESIRFLPSMGFGVPKGGFPSALGGSGNQSIAGAFPGTLSAPAIESYWMGAGGPGGMVANIAQAITAPESGRRPSAVQQGQPYATTGWGLWQITPGNSEPQAGVNAALLNPANNAQAAVAKYTQAGFSFTPWTTYVNGLYQPYLLGSGGMVPGYAAGGSVAALRAQLAAEQRAEAGKYTGLRRSFAAGPARYRTKTVLSELTTLAARQQAEAQAYAALAGTGLTTTRLHHLGAAARSESRTAGDKALSKMPGGHPLWARDLIRYLGQISRTASGTVPASAAAAAAAAAAAKPLPAVGPDDIPAYRARLAVLQQREGIDYLGLRRGFLHGPGKYLTKPVYAELLKMFKLQGAEQVAYKHVLGTGLGNANLAKLAAAARAEQSETLNAVLTRLPAGHPVRARALGYWLGQLSGAAGRGLEPWSTPGPVAPITLGPQLQVRAGEFSFDSGGSLNPGWNLAYNGTGKREDLVPAGGGGIHIHIHNGGVIGSQAELDNWLNRSIDRLARNSRLSYAFKRSPSATL
jgi:intein/homing endonuclease/transposase-like protein